ncbi:MAG: OmpA family protein [Bacteroidota bacterium]|nr:OmpA family protein [Bacteroidota bacterium]
MHLSIHSLKKSKSLLFFYLLFTISSGVSATGLTDFKKKPSAKSKKSTTKAESTGSDNAMYTNKKTAWSVGAQVGLPKLAGDIPSNLFSLGYGAYVQKALGYSLAIRANGVNGWVSGQNWKVNPTESINNNAGLNGKINNNIKYNSPGTKTYVNYRTSFTKVTIDVILNLGNINFRSQSNKIGMYVFAGAGGLIFNNKQDQLDGSGNMYNYNLITGDTKKDVLKELKALRDGKFESEGDRNEGDIGKTLMQSVVNGGVGAIYKLTDRISLSAEAQYTLTGTDLMDNQRWYGSSVPSSNGDAFLYVSIGANYRFGSVENVYWFSNPLELPYKNIEESKKKLEKVDDLDKKVNEMQAKNDEVAAKVDSLTADEDNDGVSDYFDKEIASPNGSIVNGAGQTIFYKDENGNMLFVDPNAPDESQDLALNKGNNGTNNGTNNGNNNGNNGTNNGRNGGDNNGGNATNFYNDNGRDANNNGNGKKTKKRFNATKTKGRATILASDGKGGYQAASRNNGGNNNGSNMGTESEIGFLPAIFFVTNSSHIDYKYYPQLYELGRALEANPNMKLKVIGFTDFKGSEMYNKTLSEKRAQATVFALTNYFKVNPNQLVIASMGEAKPLTNMKQTDALAANRRVQFELETGGTIEGEYVKPKAKPEKAKATSKTTPKANTTKAPVKAKTPVVKDDLDEPAPDDMDKKDEFLEEPAPVIKEEVVPQETPAPTKQNNTEDDF